MTFLPDYIIERIQRFFYRSYTVLHDPPIAVCKTRLPFRVYREVSFKVLAPTAHARGQPLVQSARGCWRAAPDKIFQENLSVYIFALATLLRKLLGYFFTSEVRRTG